MSDDTTPPAPPADETPAPTRRSTKATVTCRVHLDDSADTGRYYQPGDVITGWSAEKIARMAAADQVTVG